MGKKKTRSKRANQLDVTRVKQMLKNMKDDDLNKNAFSVNKGKANDNFLQVEKVKTVTRVKPADNQYEGLAKNIVQAIAKDSFSESLLFFYSIYNSKGKCIGSLSNKQSAEIYAKIISIRLDENVYLYDRERQKWLIDTPDYSNDFNEGMVCEEVASYVILVQEESLICPVGIFREAAYMELCKDVLDNFFRGKILYIAGLIASSGYTTLQDKSLKQDDWGILHGEGKKYNLYVSLKGILYRPQKVRPKI